MCVTCAVGECHTVTLSCDGRVHSFGLNDKGQLGLVHNNNVSVPSPIPNLAQIKQVSCGKYFTVCVDHEGIAWSFGKNEYGQLGTGNTTKFNFPQKIEDIPPVLSVACGANHTLIITNNSDLWSCGCNEFGQLCLGNQENQSKFQQTSFSNIARVSLGDGHSLFQNKNGEIYACGSNNSGELGLGHFNSPQITPSLIPNLLPNIIQFSCAVQHNLFLDAEGNVYAVGGINHPEQLGIAHTINRNTLKKIPNIPPIQTISCIYFSSYLIDFEGNVWSFGKNWHGQLGLGDRKNKNVPTKIKSLTDITQISHGCFGKHFLAKDSQNRIFVTGLNSVGQLGEENEIVNKVPIEINSQYFAIWEEPIKSRAKSGRK